MKCRLKTILGSLLLSSTANATLNARCKRVAKSYVDNTVHPILEKRGCHNLFQETFPGVDLQEQTPEFPFIIYIDLLPVSKIIQRANSSLGSKCQPCARKDAETLLFPIDTHRQKAKSSCV